MSTENSPDTMRGRNQIARQIAEALSCHYGIDTPIQRQAKADRLREVREVQREDT